MDTTLTALADEFDLVGWSVQLQQGLPQGPSLIVRERPRTPGLVIKPSGRRLEIWTEDTSVNRRRLAVADDVTSVKRQIATHLPAPSGGSGGDLGAVRTTHVTRRRMERGCASGSLRWTFTLVATLLLLTACGTGLIDTTNADRTGDSSTAASKGQMVRSVTGDQLRSALAKVEVLEGGLSAQGVPEYERDEFGSSWTDEHGVVGGDNGCATRDEVLARDLRKVELESGSQCEVASGVLVDPYTGRRIEFSAASDPSAVHVEHIYPLSLAWQAGAYEWSEQERINFANDIRRNLMAVDGSANMSKGDDPPAEWLPPNKAFRCNYLYRFLKVAAYWDLPVTADDATVVNSQAEHCPPTGDRNG